MSNVREILERALASGEVTRGFLDRANLYERAIKEAVAALDAEGVGVHIEAITEAVREDEEYAISWHANIAMAYQDEGGDHAVANRAAARFMQQLFGVDASSAIPPHARSKEPARPEQTEAFRDVVLSEVADESGQSEDVFRDRLVRAKQRIEAALNADEEQSNEQ